MNYRNYIQSPLQPLADNLESATYETFENDSIKYDLYEFALEKAFACKKKYGRFTQTKNCQGLQYKSLRSEQLEGQVPAAEGPPENDDIEMK